MSDDDKRKGGRPSFRPTRANRDTVAGLAGGGMRHEDIAIAIGISTPTLRKHFEAELSQGAAQKRAAVLLALQRKALEGNVSAAKAYLAVEPEFYVPGSTATAAPAPAPVAEAPSPALAQPLGKKEAAQAAAKTAQLGTGWDGILPGSAPLQ